MIIIFDPRQQSMSFLEARLHHGDDDGESAKFMKILAHFDAGLWPNARDR